MALFGNRYLKEGPGVYADDPPQSPRAQFFSILGRKFWTIGSLNLLYIVFSLPVIIFAYLLTPFLFSNLFHGLTVDSIQQYLVQSGIAQQMGENVRLEDYAGVVLSSLYVVGTVFLIAMSLVVMGPVHAGVTYVLRNYAREEHAFVWSDFWEHAKSNFRQSTAASLLSLVVTVVLVIGLSVYRSIIGSGFLSVLVTSLFVLFFLIFMIMQMYIYPMMVTFELSLKHMYKNAFLFFSLRLFPNIGILLICIGQTIVLPIILVLLLNQIGLLIYIVYFLTVGFGIQFLLVNFYVYRQLDKYMLQQLKSDQPEDGSDIEEPAEISAGPVDQDSGWYPPSK